MPRIERMVIKGEPALCHVVSRTALDGFVLGDIGIRDILKCLNNAENQKRRGLRKNKD